MNGCGRDEFGSRAESITVSQPHRLASETDNKEAIMAITYEDALAKLHEWTDSPALRNHARGVEAAMRRAAYRYGAGAAKIASIGISL